MVREKVKAGASWYVYKMDELIDELVFERKWQPRNGEMKGYSPMPMQCLPTMQAQEGLA